MKKETDKRKEWVSLVQKVSEALEPHLETEPIRKFDEIYWDENKNNCRYLGRIRSDRKVELVCEDMNLDDLGFYCDIYKDLREKGIEVIELYGSYNGDSLQEFLRRIKRDANNILELANRLEKAQTVYIPETAKITPTD